MKHNFVSCDQICDIQHTEKPFNLCRLAKFVFHVNRPSQLQLLNLQFQLKLRNVNRQRPM
jgi:hypothetical protein